MAAKSFLRLKNVASQEVTVELNMIDSVTGFLGKTVPQKRESVFASKDHYEVTINKTMVKVKSKSDTHHNETPNFEFIWALGVFLHEIIHIYTLDCEGRGWMSLIKDIRVKSESCEYNINNLSFHMAEYIVKYLTVYLDNPTSIENFSNNRRLLENINNGIQEINTAILIVGGITGVPMDDCDHCARDFRVPDLNMFISHGLWFFQQTRSIYFPQMKEGL